MQIILLTLANRARKRRIAKRSKYAKRFWVQSPNINRSLHGGYDCVINNYRLYHPDLYKDTVRMEPACFDKLLDLVRNKITKVDTEMRQAIPAEQRLCLTILFLSTGDSFRLISMFFRVGISTARQIVYETCQTLWDALQREYLSVPNTTEKWQEVASE